MKNYEDLIAYTAKFERTEVIGTTVGGREIPLIHLGKERHNPTLLIGSIHAREHITTELLFRLVDEKSPYAFDILPVLNIDGVLLCKNGLNQVHDQNLREKLRTINGGLEDFSLWKANFNAVDLNVNFDADWGTGLSNKRYRSSSDYIGEYPESEPETKAVADLIRREKYAMVVSYHSKGEVIYWGYGDRFYHRDSAERYSRIAGYPLTVSYGSAGGLKDYYCKNFAGLGMTVEVGEDRFSHPYPESELPTLVEKHKRTLQVLDENGKAIRTRILHGRGNYRS